MNENYDYWVDVPTAQSKARIIALKIETIEAIDPLDDQFGIDPPKSVPDGLCSALFGQPDPPDSDVAADFLNTYAILDAAKIPNLTDTLETSGLEHKCLFKGAAYEDAKDAAPWIVKLEEGNKFTRNLFTKSDAPWHLWDADAGIYLRSTQDLDATWQHFRKFTRAQDRHGKWYYIRYYDPASFLAYVPSIAVEKQITFFGKTESFVVISEGQVHQMTLSD